MAKLKLVKQAPPVNTPSISDSTSTATNLQQTIPQATMQNSRSKPATDSSKNEIEATDLHDRFLIEVFASPAFAFQYVQAGNNDYENRLRKGFGTQPGVSIGLRVAYRISDTWFAKIGVQYLRLKTRLRFEDSLLSVTTATNTFRTVRVPLLLSYQPTHQHNISAQFSAGLLLDVSSNYRGKTFSALGNTLHFRQDRVYKSSVGASAYMAASIGHRVKNRVDVFIEPWLALRLGNEVNNMMDFRQKLHAAGLAAGARYRLYKLQSP